MKTKETPTPRKISRRDFLKASGLIGTGLLVAGCGAQAVEKTKPAESAKPTAPAVLKGTTITVWTFFAQDNYKKWYQFIADEFKKTHPDVTVKVEYPGFDLITQGKSSHRRR